MSSIRNMIAGLRLRLPHNRRRWERYMGIHYPVLNPALPDCPEGQLITLHLLDILEREQLSARAPKLFDRLHSLCSMDVPADRALFNFLAGSYDRLKGNYMAMARRFRVAIKYGLAYHVLHVELGFHYLSRTHRYARAADEFSRALDLLYAYHLPQEYISSAASVIYAQKAAAHVVMHQPEEAAAALRLSDQLLPGNPMMLSSSALHHAALRHPTEARRFLDRLADVNSDSDEKLRPLIDQILADQHPHFTAMPIGDAEKIAAFWQGFLEHEDELKAFIETEQAAKAFNLIRAPLQQQDPYEEDYWIWGLYWKNDTWQFNLSGAYSRTYCPWVEQVLAACPPELHERWHITSEP